AIILTLGNKNQIPKTRFQVRLVGNWSLVLGISAITFAGQTRECPTPAREDCLSRPRAGLPTRSRAAEPCAGTSSIFCIRRPPVSGNRERLRFAFGSRLEPAPRPVSSWDRHRRG